MPLFKKEFVRVCYFCIELLRLIDLTRRKKSNQYNIMIKIKKKKNNIMIEIDNYLNKDKKISKKLIFFTYLCLFGKIYEF